MRKTVALLISLLCCISVAAQDLYEQYIARYSDAAVAEMYRSGVPASITLAQGLLESGMGRSTLAVQANNHFGIKCHGWTGMKVYHDDDAKDECFRKYESVEDSYSDHSDFLRYKDRYKFLFDLEPTDYKGWCYGLKSAGYATDPSYANKLINIIEKYRLYEFDRPQQSGTHSQNSTRSQTATRNQSSNRSQTATRNQERKVRETAAGRKEIPESPSSMEKLRKADGFSFSLSREVYERNSVPCVLAFGGETLSSIAAEYDLFPKEILRFNESDADRELKPGELVYIRAKKNQSRKGLDKHICDIDGENLYDISQRYGVKLKSILKMNGLKADSPLREGDVIKLRRK